MKLPNPDKLVVEQEKIADYLLKHGSVRGDVGTAVLVHGNGGAFEVEFVGNGHTVALLTLERNQVRPLQTHDMPHARELSHA